MRVPLGELVGLGWLVVELRLGTNFRNICRYEYRWQEWRHNGISQKLDEKLLEMKWNIEQAEKESKVLQDALHPFDDWLRLVENGANPMPKDLSEADICAKAKELKFINDMCDRVERYFDVTSIKGLLLILEHRFEKAVKTKVNSSTSENNSISNSC